MASSQTGFCWLVVVLVAIFTMSRTSGELLMLLDGSSSNDSDDTANSTGNSNGTLGGQYINVKMYSKEFSNDSCIPFTKSWRMDDLPNDVTGDPAGPPEDVFVTFLNPTREINNETFIRVGWRPEATGFDKIKGFLVVIESQMSERSSCFIAILNTSLVTSMGLKTEDYFFYDFLEPLSANEDFTVFVANLPPSDQIPMLPKEPVVLLRTGHYSDNNTLAEHLRWSPNVAVRKAYGMTAQAEVRFTENSVVSPQRMYVIAIKMKTQKGDSPAPISEYEIKCVSPTMECIAFLNVTVPEFAIQVAANDDMCNRSCLVTETSFFKIDIPVVTEVVTLVTRVVTTHLETVTSFKTTEPSTTQIQKKTEPPKTTPKVTHPVHTEAAVPAHSETTDLLTLPTSTLLAIVEPISSYKRANHTLVGGLLGGLTAAGLFTLLVVVFTLMDKGKAKKEASKKNRYY